MKANHADPLRYYSFNRYLRRRYGCRVHKVTVHAGFTCPNRDGTAGVGGCTFCNNSGFSPSVRIGAEQVAAQLTHGIEAARRRKARKFLAYFQAYTNTYGPLGRLKSLYDEAWKIPDVVGMSVGTRPDCVNEPILDLIGSYTERGEVWVEYGLQSAFNETLVAVNRCDTYENFLQAVEMSRGRGLKLCVHTILGLPGEDREMMLETHRRLARLPIDGIKIHLLHIMRNTVMEEQYASGRIELLSRPEYASLVVDVLEVLRPDVVIQRMHADAPRDVLVAPLWCLDKVGVLEEIRAEQARRDSWQGKALGFDRSAIPPPEGRLISCPEHVA